MIRIYQCKDDCCLAQVPSKRFWCAEYRGEVIAAGTTRMAALTQAAEHVMSLPLEVTG